MTTADLVVRNGTVVTSRGRADLDIAASGGLIVAIGARGGLDVAAREEVDATGRFVLPGVIDGHVHFREPGLTHKEDFGSGSEAAVMGGVTTVIDMPNTLPPTDSVEHARLKARLAESKAVSIRRATTAGGASRTSIAVAPSGPSSDSRKCLAIAVYGAQT